MFEVKFGTPKPIVFREYCVYGDNILDIDLEARFAGKCEVSEYDGSRYGNDEEVKWVLRQPFSETGLRNREIIHQNRLEERALLIPTFYLDRPKYTIGLGDSFTGGMQLCF